jgi:RNA polymerase sigma-70 factor (ECF subfamily)
MRRHAVDAKMQSLGELSMTDSSADTADALVDRLRTGDPQALGELFSLYRGPLRRMIDVRLDPRLNGRISASDVLQEVFVDAAKRVPHFLKKPEMPFLVWVRLVAGQRLVDVHRQHLGAQMRDAGQEISINRDGSLGASSMCLAARLVGNLPSPSHAAQKAELTARLEEALNCLEPIDREVLALRHFEELSNRDTAAMLGIDPSAASKRYLRALERLKSILQSVPGLLEGGL